MAVPVTTPVEGPIVSPGGNPLADHDTVAVLEESSETRSRVSWAPVTLVCGPGCKTDTSLTIFQVNVAEPEYPAESVAVTVTMDIPLVSGFPEMTPVADAMLSPGGSPVAEKDVTVALGNAPSRRWKAKRPHRSCRAAFRG